MRTSFGRAVSVWLLVAAATALIAGCKTAEAEPKIEYRTANVAVAAPCVIDKPDEVVALMVLLTEEEWSALAPGAKAQAVRAQAGDHMNFEARLLAATSGCGVIGSPRSGSTGEPENLLPASP